MHIISKDKSLIKNSRVSIVALVAVLILMLTGCNFNAKDEPKENTKVLNENEKKESESVNTAIEKSDIVEDGEYELFVELNGGSGKATVKSPTKAVAKDGKITVTIEWSSKNYDYMIVDGVKYLPVNEEGNSRFEIPITGLNSKMSVIADTVAMSKPHEIDYEIVFSVDKNENQNNDTVNKSENDTIKTQFPEEVKKWYDSHKVTEKMELKYAEKYQVVTFDDMYRIVEINGTDFYLIIDKNGEIPSDLPKCVTVIERPMDKIYVVGSASFDYFSCLDALDQISFTSFEKNDVKDEKLLNAMNTGTIKYAGKYSAPDYEMLLFDGCRLVVENTMITHSPDVLEQIKKLGMNTIIDYSSHESTPLGRMEWIKLYGILTGKEIEAGAIFNTKEKELKDRYNDTGKSVAYFYITNSGGVVVRKNQDYIAELIEISGGNYIFRNDKAFDGSGTETIQKEAFFKAVMDCDYLIYNSTINGEIKSCDELVSKFEILKNTKAYKEGNIYCTTDNIYLSVMSLPEIAEDINRALNNEVTKKYLYNLK